MRSDSQAGLWLELAAKGVSRQFHVAGARLALNERLPRSTPTRKRGLAEETEWVCHWLPKVCVSPYGHSLAKSLKTPAFQQNRSVPLAFSTFLVEQVRWQNLSANCQGCRGVGSRSWNTQALFRT